MMRLPGRNNIYWCQGTCDPELVAKCVGDKLLERRGIGLPAETSNSLFSIEAFHPVHAPLDTVGFANRTGGDYFVWHNVDKSLTVKVGGIAQGSDVGTGRNAWFEITRQASLTYRTRARYRPSATYHRVEARRCQPTDPGDCTEAIRSHAALRGCGMAADTGGVIEEWT
jgi:hypothetical protein